MLDGATDESGAPEATPPDGARSSWREAHRQLQRIARRKAALDAEEARWLIAARAAGVHRELGYGSFGEYLERLLGYAPRTARERLRVAEALPHLPAIRAAMERGDVPFSAVREITRVTVPETEQAWLAAAQDRSLREIEDLVVGRGPGDLPGDPPDPDLTPRIRRMELLPEVFAQLELARRHLEAEAGGPLDDNELMAAMCRQVLDGPAATANPTRPRHQIAVTVCQRCDAATMDAAGKVIDIGPGALALARCDAAHVGRIDDPRARTTIDIPRKTRRFVERRDHGRCCVPGCRSSRGLEIHHIVDLAMGGDHSPSNLILLCAAHHHAHHAGKLKIVGTAPGQLRFEHADGRRYGLDVRGDPRGQVRQALRKLGFSSMEAARAVEEAAREVPAGERYDLEKLLLACLRRCPVPAERFTNAARGASAA